MSDISEPVLTETGDMRGLHMIFRKALAVAPDLVGDAPAGDTARSAVVGTYYDNILRLLHAHHLGEDDLVWPKLLERCPDQTELVSEVAAQHEVVVPLMDAVMGHVQEWTSTASETSALALEKALGQLNDALVPHLDQEEAEILPLCSRYITKQEWAELPEHGMKHFDGDKPWLIFGQIFDNMPPAAREHVLESMPPPVAGMWANFGSGAYNDFMAQLAIPAGA